MIVFRLTTRLGISVKEDRKTANDQAKTLMGQVGRREFKIASPDTAAVHQAGAASPRISKRPKNFSLEDQEGL